MSDPRTHESVSLEYWRANSGRLRDLGLYAATVSLVGGRRVLIHDAHSTKFLSSGSFVIECEGLDGAVKDVPELERLTLAAVKSLGWGQFRVSKRRILETAFGRVDYDCRAEGRYKVGEVDVLLEGFGIDANAPELDKFDLGLRLTDGKVRIYGISRSRPNYTSSFQSKFEKFEDTFNDLATINQLAEGLGVDLSQVEWSENHSKATVKVSSGFGIQ